MGHEIFQISGLPKGYIWATFYGTMTGLFKHIFKKSRDQKGEIEQGVSID